MESSYLTTTFANGVMDTVIQAKGRVFLQARDEQGALVWEIDNPNTVVNLGRECLAHLLAGDTTNRIVTKIGFGTSNATTLPTTTALTGAFLKAIDGATYPTQTSVQFTFSLGASENNGMQVEELGLLTANNTLFARFRQSFQKTAGVTINGLWQITF